MGSIEKIKSFSLSLAINFQTKDKEKHKKDPLKSKGGDQLMMNENDNNKSGDKGGKKKAGLKDESKGSLLHRAVYI